MHRIRFSNGRSEYVEVVALSIVCVLFCLGFVGCGKSGPQGPTGTVHGRITHKGTPLDAGSNVYFTSDNFSASGVVGQDGKFIVQSLQEPRVPAGKYQISVGPPSGPELTPRSR